MKTIANSLRDSIFSMLGRPTTPEPPENFAVIQQTMLSMLPDHALAHERTKKLQMRLLVARDVEGLWYLRAELFNHLCQVQDEALAVNSLQRLEPLFKPHLPKGLSLPRKPGSGIPHHHRRSSRASGDATLPPPGF